MYHHKLQFKDITHTLVMKEIRHELRFQDIHHTIKLPPRQAPDYIPPPPVYELIKMLWDATEPDPQIHPTGFANWDYFKRITLVALNDAGEEVYQLASYKNPVANPDLTNGSIGQVMVKFPKLYYKEHYNELMWLTGVELSEIPRPGLVLHPKFAWGNGRDEIYIGAYEASELLNMICSISGQPVRTSLNMATFRAKAMARGAGWHIMDFWTQHLLDMLFYVYYGNLNSQAVLPGYTEKTSWNYAFTRLTGRTDNLTGICGSVPADFAGADADISTGWKVADPAVANRFLFVENHFGHIWKYIDGLAYDGRVGYRKTAWACADITRFSSNQNTILSNYDDMRVDLLAENTTAYIQALGKSLLPVQAGGSSSTYYSDLIYSYLSDAANRNVLRVVLSGGTLGNGAIAGVACRSSANGLSSASAPFGSRLCFSKI